MLEVRGLRKSYGRKKNVLNDVSFTVPLNQLTCLIGLNGEGKSTILKAIMGLVPVDAGTIKVDGKTIHDSIAFVPDLSTMPGYMSVGEAIAYMRDYYPDWNQQVAEELMGFFKLMATDRIANLSKGNKAKVNLLIGFAMNRPYLLLDEPLAGIDLFTKEQIAWIFSSHYMEGKGILMTTHEIAEVEHLIDRVIFLQNGTIIQEDDSEEMRELYGKSVQDRMREVYQT
ncbi:multidrug ABC transporter ATP-binding protein [Exiguobacterium sp. Leaf187]|uniref:Multidrug ABC transporter ATP-binding protein n=1 Tax=Exiguobacterium indicum TaxID=296995 RepID=A0A0V8GBW7_9BACL|nr:MULTISPECIES: ABC transporter ATP-binding protein [Exiguobacterium]KQS23490.1 multidrug ABC transporter ATP-binding protein [Exiguobacterium sp. Leaf187]KSU47647.1 multidrug ABC transporter ATP-binding protein [Exiguobacterium enclense]SDD42620.1 ABC-2 type transport system ATP-binding protein [Exiguobacterium enclense]